MGMSWPDPQRGIIDFGNTENEVGVVKDINGGGDKGNDQDQVDDAIEEVTEVSDSVIVKFEFIVSAQELVYLNMNLVNTS